jgi:uncharacterized protein with NRDE domain
VCTFILAWRALADAPVVVAANRDERLDRDAEPPGVYATDPLVVAPRDAEAGGTWLGVNEHGVLAGVTNRWTDADLPGGRSRGLLVGDALAHDSAGAGVAAVRESVETHGYAAFNLVVADGARAALLEWDGTLSERRLDPGVHVVVNVGADGGFDVPRSRAEAGRRQVDGARRARTELAVRDGETAAAWLDRAATTLRDHESGFCVHGDEFGTRSSSLLSVGEGVHYRFADGPPCRTAYRTVDGWGLNG